MKFSKIFLVIFFIINFFSSAQSSQENILDNLFNQLEKVSNQKSAAFLETKIWSIWNEHPTNNKLTERLEFGTELMQYGDYNYALKVFDNILATDPEWSEAWNKRATLFFFMKNYPQSLNDIDVVLSIEPRHFGALSGRARIFIQFKEYQKAINNLKKAKKIYPTIRNNNLIKELEKIVKGLSV